MKNLNLNLQRQWWDKHLNGKDQEYRVISPSWCSRFLLRNGKDKTLKDWYGQLDFWEYEKNRFKITDVGLIWLNNMIKRGSITFKQFDLCTFPNGMTPPIPKFEKDFKGLSIGIGKKDWGAPDYPVFIIDCGEPKNIVNR